MFQTRKARSCSYSHPLAGTTYNNSHFLSHCSSFLDSEMPLSTHASEEHRESPKMVQHPLRATRQVQSAAQHHNPSLLSKTQPFPSRMTDRPSFSQQQRHRRMHQKRTLKRKLAINPFVDSYLFPSLDIRIINKIAAISDLQKQSISYNMEPVFRRLVQSQLMGEFTSNFVFKIQPYIRDLMGDCSGEEVELPESHQNLSKKEDLLELMGELEFQGQIDHVKSLVRYYCVPAAPVANAMLSQLLEDLMIEIYQKKNCPKDIQYCLLNEAGHRILHISQIYFSTRTLLMVPSELAQPSFEAYQRVLEEHDRQQRMTFKQSIRHNFISKIVKQQIDSSLVNYHPQPKEHHTQRKEIVERAETMVENRSKVRLSRAEVKEETGDQLEWIGESRKKSAFYGSRKQQARKEYKVIIDKLQRILSAGVRYTAKSRLDEKTQSQFALLHGLNDKYDITYTYSACNSNKILLQNAVENCSLFNTKTPLQLAKIMKMLAKVYRQDQIREIEFWQFKEIYETALGVAQPALIMKFVLAYLDFDEWGELSQKAMFRVLEEAVTSRGRSLELIRATIWNWLQRCRLVENNVLRKRNIQIWYQPVRVVYLLMVSVIFGSQYRSFEDMLAEMIKYQFY